MHLTQADNVKAQFQIKRSGLLPLDPVAAAGSWNTGDKIVFAQALPCKASNDPSPEDRVFIARTNYFNRPILHGIVDALVKKRLGRKNI
jgi:hypothetical protein